MLKIQIAAALFAFSLASQPCLAETQHDTHMKPETVDYALILPANLPHILRTANSQSSRLGLDETQKQLIRELIAEAPLQVFSRLQKAEMLERAIARDVLGKGQTLSDIQLRLDQLARLKREATEAQITTINRIQAAFSKNQFSQLLKLATAADAH